jgi:hypothetical protein
VLFWRFVGDALQRVDAAEADLDLVVTELLDGAREAFGDLAAAVERERTGGIDRADDGDRAGQQRKDGSPCAPVSFVPLHGVQPLRVGEPLRCEPDEHSRQQRKGDKQGYGAREQLDSWSWPPDVPSDESPQTPAHCRAFRWVSTSPSAVVPQDWVSRQRYAHPPASRAKPGVAGPTAEPCAWGSSAAQHGPAAGRREAVTLDGRGPAELSATGGSRQQPAALTVEPGLLTISS